MTKRDWGMEITESEDVRDLFDLAKDLHNEVKRLEARSDLREITMEAQKVWILKLRSVLKDSCHFPTDGNCGNCEWCVERNEILEATKGIDHV